MEGLLNPILDKRSLPSETNLDNITATGVYYDGGNLDVLNGYKVVFVYNYENIRIVQIAIDYTGGMKARAFSGKGWTQWRGR